jgi:glutathione S-transferase
VKRRRAARSRGGGLLAYVSPHVIPFVVDCYSAADIALAYVHLAPDGGFSLEPYPAVLAWIERVRREPGFIAMDE